MFKDFQDTVAQELTSQAMREQSISDTIDLDELDAEEESQDVDNILQEVSRRINILLAEKIKNDKD